MPGLAPGPLPRESQAAAAVGQIALARAWTETLQRHGFTAGQILLTLGDTEERRRYLNARSTIGTLLKLGAVPVINENDTVATSEIRYGDNDRLAARVATMMSADLLVLPPSPDVDGLYSTRRRQAAQPRATFRWSIASPSRSRRWPGPRVEACAAVCDQIEPPRSQRRRTAMVIASGRDEHPLQRIAAGERCT